MKKILIILLPRIEKDKAQIMAEIQDVRAATDEVGRSKASAEKSLRNLTNTLNELNKKVEECNLNLGDMEQAKKRAAENVRLEKERMAKQKSSSSAAPPSKKRPEPQAASSSLGLDVGQIVATTKAAAAAAKFQRWIKKHKKHI